MPPTFVGAAAGMVVIGICPAGTGRSVGALCCAEEPGPGAVAGWAVEFVRPQAEKPIESGATNSDIRDICR